MNRIIYSCFILLFSAVLFTSCAMEEAFEPEVPEVETELPDSVFFILADPAPLTRVTYAGDGLHADFEKEDLVGCFALNDDLTAAEGDGFKPNACYRVSVHTNIKGGKDRRFLSPVTDSDDLNKSKTKYLFYYPYDPKITSLDQLKAYTHSVNTDQNDRDRYEASDLLWDICTPIAELKSVEVEMDHAMAQIIVEVESGLIKEGTVPTLLDIPTVSKLDLVKPDLEAMTADMDVEGSYELAEDSRKNITMWEFGYATSGNLMFRAAVPANHTISLGSKILSLENPDGNKVIYRLSKGLSFEPGKNYRMTLVSKHDVVAPEVSDDESWVLDVLDPETGEPVGLLCREYLNFVHSSYSYNNDHVATATQYGAEDITKTCNINSQAWVFYNLIPNTTIPDLSSGTVLRFIYDLTNYHYSGWPSPHRYASQGIFMPKHGWKWGIVSEPGEYFATMHGTEVGPEKQYYLHGGKVEWDAENNKIKYFHKPDFQVTNAEAEKGYIKIVETQNTDGTVTKSADVCYEPASENTKVGVIVPHYLIDRRINRARGRVDERKYPLCKIGFNQFWMSESLRAEMLCDGTPLICYNTKGQPGVTFAGITSPIEAGIVYPYYGTYDPFNNPEQREYNGDDGNHYIFTPLYNKSAVDHKSFIPVSTDSRTTYYLPDDDVFRDLLDYVNPYFASKMASRFIILHINDGNGSFDENAVTIEDAAYRGETFKLINSSITNAYSGNVSGLNLRAIGEYNPVQNTITGITGQTILMTKSHSEDAVTTFTVNNYAAFQGNTATPSSNSYLGVTYKITHQFGQVRFLLKFKGQADTGGGVSVSSVAKGLATKSSSAPVEKRDVYVGLEPVEEEL